VVFIRLLRTKSIIIAKWGSILVDRSRIRYDYSLSWILGYK
jgi:hypothetical protein